MELVKNDPTIPLDEVTVLKVQNSQLQIQILQERATNAVLAFVKSQGLNENEWNFDTQRFVLVRRPVEQAAPIEAEVVKE